MKRVDWQSRWQRGETGWDLGREHPALASLWQEVVEHVPEGAKVGPWFVPGCGGGHEAAYLAQQGVSVTAADFAPEAIHHAEHRYGGLPGLRFEVADALEVSPAEARSYAGIVDRAMLCAVNPEQRGPYVQACADRLGKGGLFVGILFSKVELPSGHTGPPFELTVIEVEELLAEQFTLVHGWEQVAPERPEAIKQEFCCIWRKV